MTEYPVSGN